MLPLQIGRVNEFARRFNGESDLGGVRPRAASQKPATRQFQNPWIPMADLTQLRRNAVGHHLG